ncbi:MAG: hypothetical protein JXQ65_03950, partial [Candidatus Marinimicrobia bacterium]|nr:hypothetical protein [Candidatus Neomarinimicrobiota bacterium]
PQVVLRGIGHMAFLDLFGCRLINLPASRNPRRGRSKSHKVYPGKRGDTSIRRVGRDAGHNEDRYREEDVPAP